jgi:hypothetical protein
MVIREYGSMTGTQAYPTAPMMESGTEETFLGGQKNVLG